MKEMHYWELDLWGDSEEYERNRLMLRLIVYDIADAKRLRRVSQCCLDYGFRVQRSVFECWLEEDRFEVFWASLQKMIHEQEDAIIAYTLDKTGQEKRKLLGASAHVSQEPNAPWIF